MALDVNDARAVVTIDGTPLSGKWHRWGLTGLDGLSIRWGRSKLITKVPPTSLSLSIIDPTGEWAANSAPVGKTIRVEAQTPTSESGSFNWIATTFHGRVTDLEMSRVYLNDAETGEPFVVWRVELHALDVTAEWAQTVIPGNGPNGQWPSENAQARANRLANLVAMNPVHITSPANPVLAAHEFSEKLSLNDLLQTVVSDVPGAYINLTPGTARNTIDLGSTAAAGGLALVLVGSTMRLAETTSSYLIPASRAQVTRELTLRSSVEAALDAVNVTWTDANGDAQTVQADTSRPRDSSGGKRVWDIQTDIYNDDARAAAVAAEAVAIANAINDRLEMPSVRINLAGWRTHDFLETRVLYSILTTDKAVAFPGSVLNSVPGVGTSFQVIGGVLEYRDGWSHTLNLAPAIGTPNVVTLAGLVTNPTPTLADFDPSITVADFGLITEGLS